MFLHFWLADICETAAGITPALYLTAVLFIGSNIGLFPRTAYADPVFLGRHMQELIGILYDDLLSFVEEHVMSSIIGTLIHDECHEVLWLVLVYQIGFCNYIVNEYLNYNFLESGKVIEKL